MKKIVIKCGGSIIDELTPEFFASLRQSAATWVSIDFCPWWGS